MIKGWKVPIGGHIYTVVLTTEGPPGAIDANKKVIRLNKKKLKNDQRLLETYIHELMHGYQFEAGWGEVIGPKLMEIWAEGLASQLLGSFEIKIKKY